MLSVDKKQIKSAIKHRHHGQMSESFMTAAFLSLSGGLQDAYTYIFRGNVFANAQTGNIVLLSQSVYEKNWSVSMRYLIPLLFFALGIIIAEWIRESFRYSKNIHWRQLVLVFEILLLFIVGFMPVEFNMLANALVSFSCAMQVQAFRKVNGYAFASTMCIGNIRSAMESLYMYLKSHDRKLFKKTLRYIEIIVLFGFGAALGGHFVSKFGSGTIWISCFLLLISFFIMFIREEIEEHPEIKQDEKAIIKDFKDIKNKTESVKNIIKNDIEKRNTSDKNSQS